MSYYNPYGTGAYSPYSNPYSYYPQNNSMYGQQFNNQSMQQNPQMQQQPIQQNFIPMYYVQGVEGAKAYNMNPNSTVLLKDSDSNLLFVKTSDNQCKCVLERYRMIKDEDVNSQQTPTENKPNFDVSALVTKTDLEEFKNQIMGILGGVVNENK